MRVAVNAEQLLYRSPGGIGRYTAALLTLLPGAHPELEMVPFTAGHRRRSVADALEGAGVAPVVAGRAAVIPWPRPLLYDAWHRFGRPRLAGLGRTVDLVHAPSVAVPPVRGVPLVVTVHDAAPELFPDAFPPRGRRFHASGLQAAARRADVVITVTQAAADEIASHSAIPAERIRVVHNAVDPPAVEGDRVEELLARLGVGSRPYVLWVGSLEPRKDVGTLIAAMAEVKRRDPASPVHTVLAGFDGWLGEGLIDPADRRALGDSLHQLGRVGEADLWSLYAGATVFAFPSRHEGFGLPVVEAMSQAVPVVAADIPAVREVAGGAAVLVDPGDRSGWADAISALLVDPAERARLGAAGQQRSGDFSVRRWADATRAVYDHIGS